VANEADMELIELARSSWGDSLQALSRECAGGTAHIRSAGADGTESPTSLLDSALQGLRYDRVRREVEVSIALEHGALSRLRYFVVEPDRIFVGRRSDGRAILVLDRNGARTLIQLSTASAANGSAVAFADEDDAGPEAVAGTGA
jgi:hypothetical protein